MNYMLGQTHVELWRLFLKKDFNRIKNRTNGWKKWINYYRNDPYLYYCQRYYTCNHISQKERKRRERLKKWKQEEPERLKRNLKIHEYMEEINKRNDEKDEEIKRYKERATQANRKKNVYVHTSITNKIAR